MKQIDNAIILAAGRGSRLGKVGEQTPKGLLNVNGEILIKRSMKILRGFGIRNFTVVVGHLSNQYEREFVNSDVRLVHNRLLGSGSFTSLLLGLRGVSLPALLLDSDIIFEPRCVQVLLGSEGSSAVLTSSPTDSGDEVWVKFTDGRLHELSKSASDSDETLLHEFVGIAKIGEPVFAALEDLYRTNRDFWSKAEYERAISVICSKHEVGIAHGGKLRWAEIDDLRQLQRARLLFPKRGRPPL